MFLFYIINYKRDLTTYVSLIIDIYKQIVDNIIFLNNPYVYPVKTRFPYSVFLVSF